MTLDPYACHALAVDMVEAAVNDLKAHHKQRDIDFFLSPERSEIWLVAAGLDYDATISRLRRDGHLVAAPPKIRPPTVPTPKPERSAYQLEMERRVLAKLPLYPETACTARRMADAVGVYVAVVRTALNGLKARGLADCRAVPLRGGMTNLWWKISRDST